MAVYYKWIKGCQAGAGLESGQWTYLTWGSTKGTNDLATVIMPTLSVVTGKENDTTKRTNLGYLLTNDMPSPRINKEWNFNSAINFIKDKDTNLTNGPLGKIHANNGWLNISSYSKSGSTFTPLPIKTWSTNNSIAGTSYVGVQTTTSGGTVDDKWRIKILENKDSDSEGVTLPDGIIINGSVKIRTGQATDMHNNLYVEGGIYLGTQFEEDGSVKSTSATATFPAFGDETGVINFFKKLKIHSQPVEAQFFNATSDKRAKENIKLATYNALELIKKLPVYTYNYKNKSENVTGILAQDLLEAQPKELDLVSNINATGENNDYMSIKNDKLMFVLMKAIQEQQEQIERLEIEIAKLKK